jgi:hypothetical protein
LERKPVGSRAESGAPAGHEPNALHLFAEDGKIAYLEAVKAG